jgi:hypothetical protein
MAEIWNKEDCLPVVDALTLKEKSRGKIARKTERWAGLLS